MSSSCLNSLEEPMAPSRESVKKKIILATISLLEREGLNSITTRNVAKEAKVNIAAINYYFGTKEGLLKETFKLTLNHFSMDLETILKHKNLNIYSQLKVFLIFILRGSIRYPNFMKILLTDNLDKVRYIEEFTGKLKSFLKRAEQSIMQSYDNKVNIKAEVSLMQIFYAVLAPGLMTAISKDLFGIDLTKEKNQLFYVDYLLRHYLTWVNNEDIRRETFNVNILLKQILNSPENAWK